MTTLERLIKVFSVLMPDVDTSGITEDTSLAGELGVNSISVLLLVIGIEEEFGIEFQNVRADVFKTVGDVVRYVDDKLKG